MLKWMNIIFLGELGIGLGLGLRLGLIRVRIRIRVRVMVRVRIRVKPSPTNGKPTSRPVNWLINVLHNLKCLAHDWAFSITRIFKILG